MQRVLVTGSSSGIGRALVVELAKRGHEVVATARRLDAIADAVEAGHPPMRLNATADAEALVAERRAMNDVEWERSSLAFMELG